MDTIRTCTIGVCVVIILLGYSGPASGVTPPTPSPPPEVSSPPSNDPTSPVIITTPRNDSTTTVITELPPDAPNITIPVITTTPRANSTTPVITTTPKANSTTPVITTTPKANSTTPVITTTPKANSTTPIVTTTPRTNSTTPIVTTTPKTNSTTPIVTTTPTTTSTGGCHRNYTVNLEPATFASPNYPNKYPSNMYCEYRFTVSSSRKRAVANSAARITFLSFEMEDDTYCLYDYIAVYDGTTTDAPLIGRYCGTTIPPEILGTTSDLLVVFVTDDSNNFNGFTTDYVEEDISYPNCLSRYTNQITASASVQTITNSAYPGTYAVNTDEYFLVINSATLILQLKVMDIEQSKGCIYDSIVIYDGGCPSFGVLYKHCGTRIKRWELTGSEYLIHFHTDSSVQQTGFQMEIYLGVAGTGPTTTTTTTLGPPVESEIAAMDEVLTNYSVENFPSRDLSSPIGTTVDMFLVGINDLDEVQQKLTTTVLIDARWQDDYLKWDPAKKGGVIKLLIPQNDIWKPDLALLNGFESLVEFGDKFMFVVVDSNGDCQWRPYQILASTCKIDMTNYPYDTQSCDLKFSTWSTTAEQVVTTIGGQGMAKHEYFVENSHWTLLTINQKSETIGSQSLVSFTLQLKRNPTFVVFYVAIPVVMLAILNVFTFALPPASGEKGSFSIVVFLSFVVYIIVTYQKMPENSDRISLFALYVLIMTFLSSITCMLTAIELRIVSTKSVHKTTPQRVKNFTEFICNLQHKLMCIKNDANNVRTPENKTNRHSNENNQWQLFVSALDFLFFWLFLALSLVLTLCFLIYLSVQ